MRCGTDINSHRVRGTYDGLGPLFQLGVPVLEPKGWDTVSGTKFAVVMRGCGLVASVIVGALPTRLLLTIAVVGGKPKCTRIVVLEIPDSVRSSCISGCTEAVDGEYEPMINVCGQSFKHRPSRQRCMFVYTSIRGLKGWIPTSFRSKVVVAFQMVMPGNTFDEQGVHL